MEWDTSAHHNTEAWIYDIVEFWLRDCQFVYNHEVYKQMNGLPMALPLSPILADIVMEYILDQAIAKLNYRMEEV